MGKVASLVAEFQQERETEHQEGVDTEVNIREEMAAEQSKLKTVLERCVPGTQSGRMARRTKRRTVQQVKSSFVQPIRTQ